MSSHDPSAEQPPSPPVNEAIMPPSAVEGAPPASPPDGPLDPGLPARSIVGEAKRPHPNFWWSLLWSVLFLLITQIPGGVLAVLIALALMILAPQQYSLPELTDRADLLQSEAMRMGLAVGLLVIGLSTIGFSLLIIRLVVGRDWMRQLAVRRPSLAHTGLAVASLPALMLLGNVAYEVLRNVLHVPSLSDLGVGGMEEMLKVASGWPWWLAVLVIGLGPGIGEELWCRGFLGRGLVGNYGAVIGVLAASFLFGLIHLDPCQGTMAMFMGLWLHFVYLTTRSLWLPMLLHFANNSFSVLSSRVPYLEFLDAKPETIPVLVYVSAFLLLGAAAYALYQSRARLAPASTEQIALWRPAWQGVEYPPSHSGMHVIHPTPSPVALALMGAALVLLMVALANWRLV